MIIINKNNRYLPKSLGVEVESYSGLIEGLRSPLRQFFPTGNTESSMIHEAQTVPVNTNKPLDVVLLGEVTRRCIPNYVKGASDVASASAHCHAVDFPYEMELGQREALMFGLMPFLSLSWCRPKFTDYTFRAGMTGRGSGYSRFETGLNLTSYHDRDYWLKSQSTRYNKPSLEFRANENSPLWTYFITPLLNNHDMVERLILMKNNDSFKAAQSNRQGRTKAALSIYNETIEEVKLLVIPTLLEAIPGILENFREGDREFMGNILVAYLNEDEEGYNKLVNGLIKEDEGLTKFFDIIDTEVAKHVAFFNVLESNK